MLAALLAELTDRQREVARLLLIEGLRRAEAAERLGVSRATVSVIATRGESVTSRRSPRRSRARSGTASNGHPGPVAARPAPAAAGAA